MFSITRPQTRPECAVSVFLFATCWRRTETTISLSFTVLCGESAASTPFPILHFFSTFHAKLGRSDPRLIPENTPAPARDTQTLCFADSRYSQHSHKSNHSLKKGCLS
ncbi:hypothetical protein QL285_064431 [Trifolium repens]|nr:hypothetical protein QL285_064431 [Trifolium repens]